MILVSASDIPCAEISNNRACNINFKATIPDSVPVILTWVCIIITVSVYSYNTYNDFLEIRVT